MKRQKRTRHEPWIPRSRTKLTAVRARRMTPDEQAAFLAAYDALLRLLADRAVAAARTAKTTAAEGTRAGDIEEGDNNRLFPSHNAGGE